jgi:hypothetical protein
MPKLTLRDLFAVMTLAAVLLAWWMDHRRQAKSQAEMREAIRVVDSQVAALKQELERAGDTVKIIKDGVVIRSRVRGVTKYTIPPAAAP